MTEVRLHDGNTIPVVVEGRGPTVLLPVNPVPIEGPRAEELRKWGTDPALGRTIVDGLSDAFRVVAFDYEGHVLQIPKPDTLTPENMVKDLLAVADAAGAERFTYYGYSWLALSGLQLAIRTGRLTGLVMGGYPPLDGPYEKMLRVTTATHALATAPRAASPVEPPAPAADSPDEIDWSTVEMTLSEAQTRQFVTLYEALRGFDDRAAQARISCPRMCFVGSADEIDYDERWGGVRLSIAEPVIHGRAELEALGWQVHILDGLDHTGAMQAARVLPILRSWLTATLLPS
jgi:pimeloyl-ACP methyl ester carboxylesterase